jgi:myosin V
MCWPFRLQIDAISRLSSFVMDKQESESVQKAHTDSHGRNDDLIRKNEDLLKRNDDLVKKIEESGKIVTKLHENLERYLIHIN